MRFTLVTFFLFLFLNSFSQKLPEVFNHQNCATAKVVCNITDTPNENALCNSSCNGNNALVNGTNSCFTNNLERWGFYIFTIKQSGTLTFTINPDNPNIIDCGDYNFALFDVTTGCGSIGNAIRCSANDDGCSGANTGLDLTATDTTEGSGGDGWNKYLDAKCGHTYLLCLDSPNNDGNGYSLSFGGTCLFGVPVDFTASPDTVCAGQPVTFTPNCYVPNAFVTYTWNFGPNATPSTFAGPIPPNVSFSTTGTQNITLTGVSTGDNICTNFSTQTVFVAAGAATSPFSVSGPACTGTNTTVTYTGNASSTASYTWNFGTGAVLSGSGQGPYVISYPSPGSYPISLDVTECATPSGVTTNTVTVFAAPLADAGPDVSICIGSSASLSGSGGAQYGWQSAAPDLSCNLCQNTVATPTAMATYTLAVIDGNGCTDTDDVNVTVSPLPVANAGPDITICANTPTPLSASGGAIYSWSPAVNLSNPSISNPTANLPSSASYTVSVSNPGGCLSTDDVSITVTSSPVANAGSNVTLCTGASTTLSASGGVTYVWTPAAGLSNLNISDPVATPVSTTTYSVTVDNGNGCTSVASVTVTLPTTPLTPNLTSGNAGCGMANGTATSGPTGGSGAPYTYNWGTIPPQASATATGLAQGNYSITVTDANGCTTTGAINVTQDAPPVAGISGNVNLCEGGSTVLTASPAGASYLWSTLQNTSSITVSPSAATTYSVLVTSGNCTATATANVVVNGPPTANAGADVTIFYGTSTVLNAAGGSSYNWSPSTGLSCTNCQDPSADPLVTTNYTVIVTDANGCTNIDTITVFVDDTCEKLYLPTAFSPNADGENDEFHVYINNLACIIDLEITIWDKWGKIVFESKDKGFSWNGSPNRGLLKDQENSAVFVYRMKATLLLGSEKIDKKGNISLIR